MHQLADIALACVDVVKAELREVARTASKLMAARELLRTAMIFATIGVLLMFLAAFIAIAKALGAALAALLVGAGVLLFAAVVAGVARWVAR